MPIGEDHHRNAFHPVLEEILDVLKNNGIDITNFPKTAFGDSRTAELSPLASWTFIYNINPELIKSTVTGAGSLSTNNSKAILSTGAGINSSAKIETIKHIRYTPGLGNLVRMTAVFTPGKAGSSQIIGIGDSLDGFFFGYQGESFGIVHRQNGTDHFIPQANWSENPALSGAFILNKQVGNVYVINYQWLGYGQISFYIEDPATGVPVMVHRIKYANQHEDPHIFNPSLPLMAEVVNTTNNSDIILETPSATGIVEGNAENESAIVNQYLVNEGFAVTAPQTSLDIPYLIRSKATYQGKVNRVSIKPVMINASNTSTSTSINVHLIKNITLTVTPPVFSDVDANASVMEYSFVNAGGVDINSGKVVFTFSLPPLTSKEIDITDMGIFLNSGDTLAIGVHNILGDSGSINVAAVWKEFF